MLIERIDPAEAEADELINELGLALAQITGSSGNRSFNPEDARGPRSAFFVARTHDGQLLGCGGYRPLENGVAEIKRMYARNGRSGVGRAILRAIEQSARSDLYRELWLETRRVNIVAVSFYLSQGFREIPNYGQYAGRSEAVCFGKELAAKEPF